MGDRTWDYIKTRPLLGLLWTAILGIIIVKVIARFAWGYRGPWWLELGLPIALLIVLFTAMRRSSAPAE